MLLSLRLIDEFLPAWDAREHHATIVRADPARTYATLRGLDLARPILVRALFALRSLPELIRGRPMPFAQLTFDDALRLGFVVLAEEPGREIVLGVIGRFWLASGNLPVHVDPRAFVAFSDAGYAKAALDFRVEPHPHGCVLSTETRVRCTDAASRRKFERYWLLIGPFSALIRRLWLAELRGAAERGAIA